MVAYVVLAILVYLSLPLVARVTMDAAALHDAAVPTMYIPEMGESLTQVALTPTAPSP